MAYTLRLDDVQERHLQRVMEVLHVNTANKAFIALVERYETDQKELQELRVRVRTLDDRLYELQNLFQERDRIDSEIALRLK